MRITCPNCELQLVPPPESLGEVPLEEVVATKDSIRLYQLTRALLGEDYPHSINLATKV